MSVRALRQALRLSQGVFAEHLGVNQSTVSRWESGSVPAPSAAMEKIAALAADAGLNIDWGLLFRIRHSAAPTLLTTLDMTIVETSGSMEILTGRMRRAILGRSFRPFFTPAVHEAFAHANAESGFLAGPLVGLEFTARIILLEYGPVLARNLWILGFLEERTPLLIWEITPVTNSSFDETNTEIIEYTVDYMDKK